MIHVLSVILFIVGLPAAAASFYLLALTLLSAKPAPALRSSRRLRFDIIVPAHNEAAGIERVIANLHTLDWPRENYRIIVVADNCTDTTAALARAAGADVLERQDEVLRGKGYALELALRASQTSAWAYAVVVIDADSEVSPNLLEAFSSRIENGAKAIQAHYGVLNPHTSWRTRLMTIAMASFHILRSRARERLHLSCGIRGNGWCVTQRLLNQVPYRAFSLAEDIEYGIELGLAGQRVHYADEAHVQAEMVSGEQAARSQRQRWESGRLQLIRAKALPLLRAAISGGGAVCVDLLIDLLVLPLSYVALNVAFFAILAALIQMGWPEMELWLWLGLACITSLVLYVLRGWQLSGVGIIGIVDLLRAPFFVVWKLVLMLRTPRTAMWIRTRRESP